MEDNEGTDTGAEGGGEDKTPPTIPYARFAEVIAQKKDLASRLEASEGRAAAAERRASESDTWKSKATDLESTLETERGKWAQDSALMGLGLVDGEARDVARLLHGRLEGDDLPSLQDWIGGFKTDPSSAPVALRGYLGTGQTTDAGEGEGDTGEQPKGGGKSKGRDDQGGRGAPETLSASKIKQVADRAKETGDWSEYKKLREQLGFR